MCAEERQEWIKMINHSILFHLFVYSPIWSESRSMHLAQIIEHVCDMLGGRSRFTSYLLLYQPCYTLFLNLLTIVPPPTHVSSSLSAQHMRI